MFSEPYFSYGIRSFWICGVVVAGLPVFGCASEGSQSSGAGSFQSTNKALGVQAHPVIGCSVEMCGAKPELTYNPCVDGKAPSVACESVKGHCMWRIQLGSCLMENLSEAGGDPQETSFTGNGNPWQALMFNCPGDTGKMGFFEIAGSQALAALTCPGTGECKPVECLPFTEESTTYACEDGSKAEYVGKCTRVDGWCQRPFRRCPGDEEASGDGL